MATVAAADASTATQKAPTRELTYLETVLGYDPFKKREEEVAKSVGRGAEVTEAYVATTLQGKFGIECGGDWEDNVRLRW
jgi:hypothetical protein